LKEEKEKIVKREEREKKKKRGHLQKQKQKKNFVKNSLKQTTREGEWRSALTFGFCWWRADPNGGLINILRKY